ncbi:hypothetical protein ACFE04_001848 [Oxalis oulophora]
MPPDRSSPESSEVVDGFTLHFDGKFNFKQELNVVEYVGGRSHHWAVQPKELTMQNLVYNMMFLAKSVGMTNTRPCTPLQNDSSPKKTRLVIGARVVDVNTQKRSPRKSRNEVPTNIPEHAEAGMSKQMWVNMQSSKVNEIHSQFRIGSKLVKKQKY